MSDFINLNQDETGDQNHEESIATPTIWQAPHSARRRIEPCPGAVQRPRRNRRFEFMLGFMNASSEEQHQVTQQLAQDYALTDFVTPLGEPSAPYFCSSHTEATLDEFFTEAKKAKEGR